MAQADTAPAAEPVTFTEHVAKIVFDNCASCHRSGEIAPFALTNYREVRKRARMIVKVTDQRLMPPWPPADGDVALAHSRRLGDEQIATLREWVAGGMAEGPAEALPELPAVRDDWGMGAPDLVVSMAAGFEVPAGGPDIYRSFVIPLAIKEDKWVRAIDVRPSARSVLHHTIIRYDTSGASRERDGADGKPGFRRMSVGGRSSGGLGGWAVGAQPVPLPLGLSRRLPKGADIVLNSHLHPSGKAEREKTTIALWFADKPPTRSMISVQLPPLFGRLAGLDVPAGEKDFRIKDEFKLTHDVLAVAVSSHAHYICKTVKMTAELPSGKVLTLFDIPNWDFNWQGSYQFEQPFQLPKGTVLRSVLSYDNSATNPNQQFDPPRRVRWGPQSTDEMGSATLRVVAEREADSAALRRAVRNHTGASLRNRTRGRRGERTRGSQLSRVKQLDRNGDGKLTKTEVPERWHVLFERLDADRNGVIDEKELARLDGGRRR